MRVDTALLVTALALSACTKDSEPRFAPAPPVERVEDKLAQRAVEEPQQARELAVPAGSVKHGDLELSVRKLVTQQNLQGAKMALATQELFVSVHLNVRNSGAGVALLDLATAKLVSGGESFPIARDAQALVGRRDLALTVEPGEQLEVPLYFEVPSELVAPGLSLQVPGEAGQQDPVLILQ